MTIKRIRMADQVKEEILASIGSGKFVPGSKLPSVRQLSCGLGVSHVTAARAVRELIDEGILEVRRGAGTFAAEKLPEKLLRTQHSPAKNKTLYFFFPTLQSASSYHNSILCTIQQEAEKRNWNLRINLLSPDRFESAAADPDAAGIVCSTAPHPLIRTGVPVINYGMTAQKEIPAVIPDNYNAGCAAGIHLRNKGIETIAFVSNAPRERPVPELHFQERYLGLCDALRSADNHSRNGIPLLHWAINHPCRREVEEWIASRVQGEADEYPVLVVGNRSMAVEIGIYLSAVGLRVPEDIGLLSFIKRNTSELQIPIDTFDFDHRQMGEQIMLLLDQLQKGGNPPSRILIPMTLTEEGSVRSLRTVPSRISGSRSRAQQ